MPFQWQYRLSNASHLFRQNRMLFSNMSYRHADTHAMKTSDSIREVMAFCNLGQYNKDQIIGRLSKILPDICKLEALLRSFNDGNDMLPEYPNLHKNNPIYSLRKANQMANFEPDLSNVVTSDQLQLFIDNYNAQHAGQFSLSGSGEPYSLYRGDESYCSGSLIQIAYYWEGYVSGQMDGDDNLGINSDDG